MFCEILKSLLKSKNIEQQQLAEKLNVSTSTMSRIINGKTEPAMVLLMEIAEHFNVSIDYLLTGEDKSFETAVEKRIREYNSDDLLKYYKGKYSELFIPDDKGNEPILYLRKHKRIDLIAEYVKELTQTQKTTISPSSKTNMELQNQMEANNSRILDLYYELGEEYINNNNYEMLKKYFKFADFEFKKKIIKCLKDAKCTQEEIKMVDEGYKFEEKYFDLFIDDEKIIKEKFNELLSEISMKEIDGYSRSEIVKYFFFTNNRDEIEKYMELLLSDEYQESVFNDALNDWLKSAEAKFGGYDKEKKLSKHIRYFRQLKSFINLIIKYDFKDIFNKIIKNEKINKYYKINQSCEYESYDYLFDLNGISIDYLLKVLSNIKIDYQKDVVALQRIFVEADEDQHLKLIDIYRQYAYEQLCNEYKDIFGLVKIDKTKFIKIEEFAKRYWIEKQFNKNNDVQYLIDEFYQIEYFENMINKVWGFKTEKIKNNKYPKHELNNLPKNIEEAKRNVFIKLVEFFNKGYGYNLYFQNEIVKSLVEKLPLDKFISLCDLVGYNKIKSIILEVNIKDIDKLKYIMKNICDLSDKSYKHLLRNVL